MGPTLTAAEARTELDATYLPPAAQGDIYQAVRRGATAIGLIDGYFRQVPSVWHKEILWAISEGVAVYGSASMGALRAAELWTFGMVGIGEIFKAYRDGLLSDDDEVALVHLEAEEDFRPATVAMVDIRTTVALAERSGVIGAKTHAALVDAAKVLWYPDRTYPGMIRAARGRCDDEELAAFEQWWRPHRTSRKRDDAIAMLRRIKFDADRELWPDAPAFHLERTALFEDLIRSARAGNAAGSTAAARQPDERDRDAALVRVLALDEARRLQYEIDDAGLYDAVLRFRAERELIEPSDLNRWMAARGVGRARLLRLAADEARIAWVRRVLASEVDAMLTDHAAVASRK
ncbi:TfuA-like protein [Actinoplanes derwentensis]|uniref:TfuA-like protein n=1 Tax=Actinoplanes derwentensis TaxID=113562 RepID=UPI000A73EF46|nr:TfuA-like protein [Actinoplanes derwentensis]